MATGTHLAEELGLVPLSSHSRPLVSMHGGHLMEGLGEWPEEGSPAQREDTVAKSHSKVGAEAEARPSLAAMEVDTGMCPISPPRLTLPPPPAPLLCLLLALPPRGLLRGSPSLTSPQSSALSPSQALPLRGSLELGDKHFLGTR